MNTSNWDRAFELSGADDPAGLTAGVARVASQLALSQSATYNVDRALFVGHTLNLTQSDYWVESTSSTLALTDAAPHVNERPRSASSTLTLSQAVLVSGGRQAQSSILDTTIDGAVLAGQALYIKATGDAALADSNVTIIEAGVAGLAIMSGGGSPSGTVYYRTDGHLSLDDWTSATGSSDLVPGANYYLSSTAGVMTTTAPIAGGEFVVKVGRAVTVRILAIELGEEIGL